jgi:hypothetical protein
MRTISSFGVYYLKHAKSGAYVTKSLKGAIQWFRHLARANRALKAIV